MRRVWSNRTKLTVALTPFVLGLLSLWLLNYKTAFAVDWEHTKTVFDVIQSAVTIVALIVGAIWAYFNFFKGRTYRPRLEPKISGQFITKNGATYLVVTAQLKNVGLSDVKINREGSALRLFAYVPKAEFSKVHSVEQTRLITVGVFEEHGWIEPGETIEDQRLMALPKNEFIAVQAKLRLVSTQIEWNTAAIIEPPLLKNGTTAQHKLEAGTKQIAAGEDNKFLGEGEQIIGKMTASTQNLAKITLQNPEDTKKTTEIESEKEAASEISIKQVSNEARQIASPTNSETPQTES